MITLATKVYPNVSKYNREEIISLMKRFNKACNYVSNVFHQEQQTTWYPIPDRKIYHEIKAKFHLTAGAATAVLLKVSNAYHKNSRYLIYFKPLAPIPLFKHVYRNNNIVFYGLEIHVTCDIPLDKKAIRGVLSYKGGRFVIHQYLKVPEKTPYTPNGWLGCDLGIKNILVDSGGKIFSGAHLNNFRTRNRKIKKRLKAKNTRSSHRLLVKRAGVETRFSNNVQHSIAKQVVIKAQKASLGIAIEDLSSLAHSGTRFRKATRYLQQCWSYRRISQYLKYKASLNGVPLKLVDPRNTSKTCPICGHIDRKNRKTQAWFKCVNCGFEFHADTVAAVNIGRRADGNQPYAPLFSDVQASFLRNIGAVAIQ